MVVVAQLVRASVCGTESRRFEPGLPPKSNKPFRNEGLFLFIYLKLKKVSQLDERPFIYLLAFIYSVTALSTTKRSSLLATSQAV